MLVMIEGIILRFDIIPIREGKVRSEVGVVEVSVAIVAWFVLMALLRKRWFGGLRSGQRARSLSRIWL